MIYSKEFVCSLPFCLAKHETFETTSYFRELSRVRTSLSSKSVINVLLLLGNIFIHLVYRTNGSTVSTELEHEPEPPFFPAPAPAKNGGFRATPVP